MTHEFVADEVFGKYKIQDVISRDARGVLYRATESGVTLAIKILNSLEEPFKDEQIEEFKKEAAKLANAHYPNLLNITGADIQDGTPYILMEYEKGVSLADFMSQNNSMPMDVVLYLFSQIATALDALHKDGLIHNAVKPENIIIDESYKCYLGPVGEDKLLKCLMDIQESEAPSAIEPPVYMSPEQIQNKPLNKKSNLFSFAVMIYECLVGQKPFQGSDFSEIINNILNTPPASITLTMDVPLALEVFFERALAKNPNERFKCAREMINQIMEAVGISDITKPDFSSFNSAVSEEAVTPDIKNVTFDEDVNSGTLGTSSLVVEETATFGTLSMDSEAGQILQPAKEQEAESGNFPLDEPQKLSTQLSQQKMVGWFKFGGMSLIGFVLITAIVIKTWSGGEMDPQQIAEGSSDYHNVVKSGDSLSDEEVLIILDDAASEDQEILIALEEARKRKLPGIDVIAPKLLQNNQYLIRVNVLKILSEIGDYKSVPFVVEMLRDPDKIVRAMAATTLSKIGNKEVLEYLSSSYEVEEVQETKMVIKKAMNKIEAKERISDLLWILRPE